MSENKTLLSKLVSLRAKRGGSKLKGSPRHAAAWFVTLRGLLRPLRFAQSPRNDTLLVSQKCFLYDKEGKLFICFCCIAFIFGFVVFSYGREKYTYEASGKRNPFTPLITSDGRFVNLDVVAIPKSLSLQGVMYESNGISYAIVNGVIVKDGQMVEGSQVIKIEEKKVSFMKDGQLLELELKNGGEDEE